MAKSAIRAPLQGPGDAALIDAAAQARTAAETLAAVAEAPLYDPHTLWLVLEQLHPVAGALKTVAGLVERKIGRADEAGLLVSEQPDLCDAGQAAYEARDCLLAAVNLSEQLRSSLSFAADETACFAKRGAPVAGEDQDHG